MMWTRITVVAALAAGAALLPTTTASAAEPGGSISGTTWHDVNVDGLRQAGEPGLSVDGVPSMLSNMVLLDRNLNRYEARPDANGDYRFDNLPAGEYRLRTIARDGVDGYAITKPGGDSKADWATGWTAPMVIAGNSVDHVDVGYFKATGDPALKAALAPEVIKVGEYITYDFEVRNLGNAPAYVGANVRWPAGLIPTAATGGLWLFGDTTGNLTVPDKLLPGTVAVASFTLRAKEPVSAGEVTFVVKPGDFGDSDATNNTAALRLSVTG
jgi:hypothetical protein